ncbi:MAG: AMP-binding protein [Actinobacteria bacterium]|nr:AMP-binding protein [Actinomycetota bacterium]
MDPLHALTLADVLREHARSWPERVATVDGERRITYRELQDRTCRLAHALAAVGVGPGDRMLWCGQNSARVLELLLAAAKLGAALCPANWRLSADELAFVIEDLEPAVTVWQEEEVGDAVRTARDATGAPGRWIAHDAPDEYEPFLAQGDPDDDFGDRDPAESVLFVYTSAWSGQPAAAMLSHTAVVTQGLVFGRAADIGPESVYLNSGPLFHLATAMQTFATFVAAGANVFTRRVDAEELCRLIDAERCTGAFLVGPTIKQILAVNADGRFDLKSLRTPAGKPAWTEMITVDTSPMARNPAGYGQTEVMGLLTTNLTAEPTVGTNGRALPGVQIRIVDPDDRDVPDGETGEIVARGATVMNGYWNRPDETARRLRGGWHHTNDLGRREVDGSISFIGPKARLIKSATENIYPAEVEATLASHPAVAECAVIGTPDRQWTQSVKAIVVLRDGETVTEAELVAHVRERIASYKKPRTVAFVDRLPRVGFAVDYDTLDEQFGGGGYPGGPGVGAR